MKKRAVILEPNKAAREEWIEDTLENLQSIVGGYIEVTYPFDDNAVVVGNEEAKLVGLKGNRHINGSVYAGNLIIIGDDGRNRQPIEIRLRITVALRLLVRHVNDEHGIDFRPKELPPFRCPYLGFAETFRAIPFPIVARLGCRELVVEHGVTTLEHAGQLIETLL